MYFFRLCLIVLSFFASGFSTAQNYPTKSVKIIFPYSAGGTGDILARLIAQELTKQTGQSFVVENRTGAGGLIGYSAGAKSTGDGYTLVAMDSSYTMFPSLYSERIDWNIESSLIPISLYGRAPFALIVNSSKNYKTTQDLIKQAKERSGEVSFGTPGNGTLHHIFISHLMQTTGVTMTHIPYKGASEALNAVLGNSVDWTFVALPTITGQLTNDRMRVIAITSESRSPLMPQVPTLRESGIAMTVDNWFGLSAPKGTSAEIISYLNKQISIAIKSQEVIARMKAMGAEAISNSSEDFTQMVKNDIRAWSQVIKNAGIKN